MKRLFSTIFIIITLALIASPAMAATPSIGTYTNGIWRLTAPVKAGWPVVLAYPSGQPTVNQQWQRIQDTGQLRSQFRDPVTGKPLCATSSGSAIVGLDCAGTANQKWAYDSAQHIRQGTRCMTLGKFGEFSLQTCGTAGQTWVFHSSTALVMPFPTMGTNR